MYINPRLIKSIVLTGFLLSVPLSVIAEEKKPPKLFDQMSEMKVTLAGPWHKIEENIERDALYPAKLTYTGSDGAQHTFDVEVSPRGITRRLRVCDFPPLKIHFDKKKTKGTEFRGNKSLKLVTYCDTNSIYQQYYVKEFLAYRIYNLITEYSFRVRPMMMEYLDSETGDDPVTRFSFLIEDTDDVAKRNGIEKLDIDRVPYKQLDPETINHFALFQFLIGNLDWASTDGPGDKCCHNSKLIGAGEKVSPKFSIPYDFDSSGLVNAHYASPPDAFHMRNIRQRLYRGFCYTNDSLPQSVALFNEKKAEILALFETNTHLKDNIREIAIKYIEGFYKIINNPRRFEREITDKCRGSAL